MTDELYTDSAIADLLREFILKDPVMCKTIESFKIYPNGTFLFDPTRDAEIMRLFVEDPARLTAMLRRACIELMAIWFDMQESVIIEKYKHFKVKITDSNRIKFADWGPVWQNIPVAVEALIVSMENEKTYIKKAEAVCRGCGRRANLEVEYYTHLLQNPPRCMNENCSRYKETMDVDPLSLQTGLYRIVTIQQPMEEAKNGNPRTFKCELVDDDVMQVYMGKRKLIVGTFTSFFEKRESTQEILIKAISVQDVTDSEYSIATKDDIAEFKKWVEREDFLQLLCASLAPEVSNDDQTELAKLVTSIAVAGGTRVGRLRGDINCFIVGDPSLAKSKILGFVKYLLDKADFVNGSTATGAGITVAYDQELKAPKAGPIVICSGGVVAIDEITRLPEEDLDKLLQCMEDGMIKYDKGRFNFSVQAETAIIAGANPKNDYYDWDMTIADNINLAAPLLSRFDIWVNLVQKDTPLTVTNKLSHIDEFREIGEEEFIKKHNLIPKQMLRKYYTYIRSLRPTMSREARNLAHNFYTQILEIQQKHGSRNIDIRFYESLLRISTAFAKHYLAQTVTKKHMQLAIDLQKRALASFGMQVERGQTQMNFQQEATSKDAAFDHCFRETQAKFQSEYVDDNDVVQDMIKRYPQFWGSDDDAWKYFDHMYEIKKIIKSRGKFKMTGK